MTKPITRDMPPLSMRAAFAPNSVNVEARTAQLVWTTGARVLRGMFEPFYEELSLDPNHVRMGRLQSGAAPLLDSHRASGIGDILGVVESASLEKSRGVANVRFARTEAGDRALGMASDGVLKNVSVGYRVHAMQKVEDGEGKTPVYRAVDWEPHEITLAPMGADAGALVRSASADTNPCTFEERIMKIENQDTETPDATAVERTRAAEITKLTKLAKLGDDWATRMIADGTTVADARTAVLNELVRRDAEYPPSSGGSYMRFEGGNENRDTNAIALMSEALASRFGGKAPSAEARQYQRLSCLDFARHLLEVRGVNTRHMSRNQIVERSLHSTSDFTNLLTGTGNRLLRAAYDAYSNGMVQVCRQSSAPDFRPINKLAFGEAPTLKKVLEDGEFQRGTMAELKESYSLATFGRIFGVSRQAIVNDDLGAFADMNTRLGRAAAEFVSVQLCALLVSNPNLSDGNAVFSAAHGNLTTGPGTAISTTSLGVALKSMRLQKGLDGVTAINATPRWLVTTAANEVLARQAVAAINAAQTSNANVFAGAYEVVIEPRLDASSTTQWYLVSDQVDGIEYSYLDGSNGPEVFIREGFDVDGAEFKVRLDFGAGFLDHRGLYKNVGA